MADSPATGAEESKEPETPMAPGGTDPLPESSPWLRAKSVAESMNLEAVMEDMERRYYELLQERDTLQEKVKNMTEEKESLVASQATLTTMEKEKATLQSKIQREEIKTKGLEEEKTLLQERMDRMQVESDQLREELGYVLSTTVLSPIFSLQLITRPRTMASEFHSRIQNSHKELSSKFSNIEVEAKLKDSEAIPLLHEKQRLQTELDNLQSHSSWLEQELAAKASQYQRLLQESRDRQMQLQFNLQHVENEKIEATTKNTELSELQNRLHDQVEKLTADIAKKSQEMIHLRETTDLEVHQERHFVQQQQDQLTRWEHRYNDVVRENESLKGAAARATEATERDVEAMKKELKEKYEKLLQEQAAEYETRISQQPASVAALPPSDKMEDGEDENAPMGLTEVFERLEKTKAHLREMTHRAEKAELTSQRLVAEIQDKTPTLIRQRQEYELAMDQKDDLLRRLEKAIGEKESAQSELDHTRKELGQSERRYNEQVAETKVLAEQVQALLNSRATGASSGQDFPTSVAEMQQQNQRLLTNNRKLQKEVASLEQKLQTDELRVKLNSMEKELLSMSEEKEKQEAYVLTIVQQRDIYRSLCNLDGLPGSDSREISIEEVSRRQAEKTKELEARVKTLENEAITASEEKGRLARDKEAAEERLVRSETTRKDLTDEVAKLQSEIYKAKGDAARQEADASYFKEKLGRVEESLNRSANEVLVLGNARSELQRINAELQHNLSRERDLVSQANSQKEQAETKLRKALADVEAAKAAERRMATEDAELRREITRQGSVIESIRRIESSLAAKSETEVETLKEENERLVKQLANERKKMEAEMENLKERVRESEIRVREAEKLKSKAERDMLEAKKSLLASETEKRSLSVKCENVEAKLRAANKKLGISDDSDAMEVSLQSRVDELSGEVEKSKEEIASLQKSVESYKQMAKAAEKSYSDLSTAAEQLKTKHSKELTEKTDEIESIKNESSKRQEMIVELMNDLSKQRDEAQQVEVKLKNEMTLLQAKMETLEKDTESAKATAAAAALDLETLRGELSSTQDNYERELKLHSQARSALRTLREQSEKDIQYKQAADEKIASLNQSLMIEQEKVQKKTEEMSEAVKVLEKRLDASKAENNVLHAQLEGVNQMVEKLQSDRVAGAAEGTTALTDDSQALHKQISELREVVKYLRSDNEMIQTQLDTTKRTIDREKAAGSVLKSSLEQVRAELKAFQDSSGNSESEVAKKLDEATAQISDAEEQLRLLRDSNKVLRDENGKSASLLAEARQEVTRLKEAAKPLEKAGHDATVRIVQLEAEKDSLSREVTAWKSRVESLVSKFNQVDPEEHRKAMKQIEELQNEKDSLDKWKTTMEKENTRIREIARRLKQGQTENTSKIESQKKEIEKLKEENSDLSKASSAANSDIAKERDSLKEKLSNAEKNTASVKTQLEASNTMNNRLRDKLRQFQTTIKELRSKEGTSAAAPLSKADATQEKTVPKTQAAPTKPPPAPEKADKPLEATSKSPQVPQGGFKYGPSTAEVEKSDGVAGSVPSTAPKTVTGSSLRVDAPSFTPSAGAVAKQEPVSGSKQNDASPNHPPSAATPETQSKAQGIAHRDSSTTKEMSYKEKLLEKKRKLVEMMKRKIPSKSADPSDEQGTKKARVAEQSSTTKEIGKSASTESSKVTPTETDQNDKVAPEQPESTEASRALVPIKEVGEEKESTAEMAEDSPEAQTEPEPKKTEGSSTNQASNPFAAAGSPFGTTSFAGAPAATLGQSSTFGSTSTFGGSNAFVGTPPVSFGSAVASNTAESNFFTSGTAATAPPPASGTTAAPASGTFGSSFLNIKPPGTATPPTFSFGSSSKIVLTAPSGTAPAPSPFAAFGGSGFGAGTSFGSSFGSPNPQTFGSRPLFGAPQQEESKDENPSTEGEAKEEGET